MDFQLIREAYKMRTLEAIGYKELVMTASSTQSVRKGIGYRYGERLMEQKERVR